MLQSSRTKLIPTLVLLVFFVCLFGQSGNVAINTDGSLPDSSAILDIKSSTQGLLIPRLNTNERNAISNPKVGLEIYNLDLDCFEYFNGSNWLTNCGFLNDPTMAMAGPQRSTVKDTVHLNANNPKVSETGLWSILSGLGGTFSDLNDPEAIFSSNGNFATFLLRWTISNPCGKTYSDVSITFYREGIYVSINGSDTSGDGLPENPYKSIQKGIDEAINQSQNDVFITEGDFAETLALDNISNINLLGGHYTFDWNIQNPDMHKTRIQGGVVGCTISNSSNLTFSGINLSSERSFSGNSIGMDIINSTSISVEDCFIFASSAAFGSSGQSGVNGTDGQNGGDFMTPSPCSAPSSMGGSGGAGGAFNPGSTALDGGSGGAGGNGNTNSSGAGGSGVSGAQGLPTGGLGGGSGPGVGPCNNGLCSTGGNDSNGADGLPGITGSNGNSGLGGPFGTNGGDGINGSGGGGGGGGGGCSLSTGTSCGNRAGNSGAGGGGGGSGASAGIGGTRGFSSIGIWSTNSTVSIINTTVKTSYGGSGGNGGNAAFGGMGGEGGFAPTFNDRSISGNGGDGAAGGNSGSGGGGGGGSSICILKDSSSTLSESGTMFQPGPAGQGGTSIGNSGQNGTSENMVTY